MGWLPVVVSVALALDGVAQRARRLKKRVRFAFTGPTDQRLKHYRQLVEQLERDVIESCREERRALDDLRRAQEDIAHLRDQLDKVSTKARHDYSELTRLRTVEREMTTELFGAPGKFQIRKRDVKPPLKTRLRAVRNGEPGPAWSAGICGSMTPIRGGYPASDVRHCDLMAGHKGWHHSADDDSSWTP